MLNCSAVLDSLQPLWAVALQARLSMEFSRQEYWSRSQFPAPRDLPDPGIESTPPASPASQVDSLPLSHQGSQGPTIKPCKPQLKLNFCQSEMRRHLYILSKGKIQSDMFLKAHCSCCLCACMLSCV